MRPVIDHTAPAGAVHAFAAIAAVTALGITGAAAPAALVAARAEPVILRPVRPDDAALIGRFFSALSPRSRQRRFHAGVREVPADLLDRFAHPDRCDEAALLAIASIGGRSLCIGEARYARADGLPDAREFALAVADDWQGRGIGRRLLLRLARDAERRGVGQLHGDVMRDNLAMLALAASAGFVVRRHPDDPRLLRVVRHSAPRVRGGRPATASPPGG